MIIEIITITFFGILITLAYFCTKSIDKTFREFDIEDKQIEEKLIQLKNELNNLPQKERMN